MTKLNMRFNGRNISSGAQLQREMQRVLKKTMEKAIRKAAGPNLKLKKTKEGYLAEGAPADIERLKQRLR